MNNYDRSIRKLMIDHLNSHHSVRASEDVVRAEITSRNNNLLYRASSVVWNTQQIQRIINETLVEVTGTNDRDDVVPKIYNSLFPISYCFDDVIFNLISMFDYLASLLALIITNEPSKWIKWNSLLNTVNAGNQGFIETSVKLKKANKEWVGKLQSYRGSLYHNKSDMSSAEHVFDYTKGQDCISYLIPAHALKKLPGFRKKGNIDLLLGVNELVEKSLSLQYGLLKLCYSER